MHTVELLEQMLATADRLGYGVRHEWLGGSGGGVCEYGGRKWLFVDLALNAVEQLDQVTEALRNDPGVHVIELAAPLQEALEIRRAA